MATKPGAFASNPGATSLPVILCLHGGGTNSTIFNIQTLRLQRALANTFNFVFLDAPFQAAPGPGVLPMFDGCGPFLRWSKSYDDSNLRDETRALIDAAWKEHEFVGVLGFSQGAKLAAGLLLEQFVNGNEGFGFGVLLNSTCPPISSRLTEEQRATRIGVPSLIVVGKEDPWREEGKKLFEEHWDMEKAMLIEFDVGHRLPNIESDTQIIVDEILRLYRETKEVGRKRITANEWSLGSGR